MLIIYPSKKFEKSYKQLPKQIKIKAKQKDLIFRKNPFDSRLKTHKLQGKLRGFLSFSIGYKYRIIFEFAKKEDVVYFHSVGDHDIYE